MKKILFVVMLSNLLFGLSFLGIKGIIRDYTLLPTEPVKAEVYIPPNSEFRPLQPLNKKRVDVPSLACLERMRGDKKLIIVCDRHTLYYLFDEFPDGVFSYAIEPRVALKSGLMPRRIVIKDSQVFIQPKKNLLLYSVFLFLFLVFIFAANWFMRNAWIIYYQEKLAKEEKAKEEQIAYTCT